MKEIIKKVLNRHSGSQINLDSEMARDSLATEIAAVLESELSDTLSVDDYEVKGLCAPSLFNSHDSDQMELEF
jgi:hypothetical protein|tara:strand:- start:408 stop:626 length:219 start_codon:yes stop_codon:yes gene_type:complete